MHFPLCVCVCVGICDFGPNCRFSHMSEEDLSYLRRQVEGKLLGFDCSAISDESVSTWQTDPKTMCPIYCINCLCL